MNTMVSTRTIFSSCAVILLSSHLASSVDLSGASTAKHPKFQGINNDIDLQASESDANEPLPHRLLAMGDFEQFNELFKDAKIDLGTHELGGTGASLTIQNLYCSGITIGDIQTSHRIFSDPADGTDVLEYSALIQPFSMDCQADYSYRLIGIPGGGSVTAGAFGNNMEARIHLLSDSTFAAEPPVSSAVDYCLAKIDTNGDVSFEGDFIGDILNMFRSQVSDLIDRLAAKAACDELAGLGPEFFGKLLNDTKTHIDEWLLPLPEELADPLFPERNFTATNSAQLVSFLPAEDSSVSSVADLFASLLNENNAIFGSSAVDPTTGKESLGINTFIKESVLDGQDQLILAPEEMGGNFDPIIFDGHDRITESTLTVTGISIAGLDSLSTFEPFQAIGEYTLSNDLMWEKLSIGANLTVDIKPSSLPDTMIISPGAVQIVEEISVGIELTLMDVSLSAFLAIDREQFDDLRLGSVLSISNVMPCLLSSMEAFEISELDVAVTDITVPTLNGFISPGIDRLVTHLAEVAYDVYKPTLLRAMPGIFQGPVRSILKGQFMDGLLDNDSGACKQPTIQPKVPGQPVDLDFRDLFLDRDDAKSLGGSGSVPYGELGRLAFDLMQDGMQAVGDDGLPQINELVIRPVTERQSGIEGFLRIPETLFGVEPETAMRRNLYEEDDFFGNLNFTVSDLRVTNLDTISAPLDLLLPTEKATVLSNSVSMGDVSTPLNITVRLDAGVLGNENSIDLSLAVDSISFEADVHALMDANAFLSFPLGDALDFNCWLAALQQVPLDEEGRPVNVNDRKGLSIEDIKIDIESLKVGTSCISCASYGTVLLPDIQAILENTGAIATVGSRLPEFIETIARSENVQTSIDRMLRSAPKFCPSHPQFEENAAREEFPSLGLPTLSDKSIDTLLYSGILAANTAFVVFAETQRLKGVEPTSALSAQEAFEAPEGANLVDWTSLGNSTGLGGIADFVFGEFRELFGSDSKDLFDLESFLQSMMSEDGFIELNTNMRFEQGDFSFGISSIRMKGLDSVALFSVFEPIGPQTLQTNAEFSKIELELVLEADAKSTPEDPQVLTVKFSAEDVVADIALFAAFDVDKLGELQLGALLDTSSTFRCILSAAHEVSVPELKVTVGVFSPPEIVGLMADTDAAANSAIKATFDQFSSQITDSIPVMFNGVIRDYFSDLLDANEGDCLNRIRPWAEDSFIDFRDLFLPEREASIVGGSGESPYGDLTSTIYQYMRDELFSAEDDGSARINSMMISRLTESQSGSPGDLLFPGSIFNVGSEIEAAGLDANIRLRLSDLYVNNVDSLGTPLKLLEPTENLYTLNNSAILGFKDPVSVGARFLLGLSSEDYDLYNEVDFSMDMESVQMLLVGIAKISELSFMQFPVKDITNLQCWLATMPAPDLNTYGVMEQGGDPTLAISDFLTTVAKIGLNVTCVDCSGPRFPELSERIASSEASDSVTEAANAIFGWTTKLVEGNFLQVAVDRALNDARMRCPHSPTYDPEFKVPEYEPLELPERSASVGFFLTVIIVCAGIVLFTSAVLLITKLLVTKRHRKWVASLPSVTVGALAKEQDKQERKRAQVDEIAMPMFRSAQIPLWARLSMPFVILGNIAFFLSGHLSLGGSVSIIGDLAGQTFREDSFFEFSMATSTIELWRAGGKELAVLIFIFSFLWPYTKQLMTLALWFLPSSVVSVKTRGAIFLWLDFLAKWSMIDVFVLIITIVAFRISVTSPDVSFIPDDFYSLNLLVVPKWGLYANMTAQIISQLSSHLIIHYHRKIVEHCLERADRETEVKHTNTEPMDVDDDIISINIHHYRNGRRADFGDDEPDQLYKHAFRRPHRGETDKLVVKSNVNPVVPLLSFLVCLLVGIGSAVPTYSLNVLGLLGLFVESGQGFEAAKTNFSLFTTIRLLMRQASLTGGIGDYVGLGSLSVLLVASVVVVPALQAGVLAVQWFVSLTSRQRRRLSVTLEVLQAWQYAEVYLLAILVGSWQLGPVSEFMINPYCQPLHGVFAELSYYGILKAEDTQCLRADVAVEPSFYVLFAATLALALLNSFVMKATAHYFRDKDYEESGLAIAISNSFELNDLSDYENYSEADQNQNAIRPVPVLFTDRFRWALHREDTVLSDSSGGYSEGRQIETPVESPNDDKDVLWVGKSSDQIEY